MSTKSIVFSTFFSLSLLVVPAVSEAGLLDTVVYKNGWMGDKEIVEASTATQIGTFTVEAAEVIELEKGVLRIYSKSLRAEQYMSLGTITVVGAGHTLSGTVNKNGRLVFTDNIIIPAGHHDFAVYADVSHVSSGTKLRTVLARAVILNESGNPEWTPRMYRVKLSQVTVK